MSDIVTRWGNWRANFAQNYITLDHKNGYWIDMSLCETEEEAQRWIDHMSEKTWVTHEEFANLVRGILALRDHIRMTKN